jgi:hypothetical protein
MKNHGALGSHLSTTNYPRSCSLCVMNWEMRYTYLFVEVDVALDAVAVDVGLDVKEEVIFVDAEVELAVVLAEAAAIPSNAYAKTIAPFVGFAFVGRSVVLPAES